MFGNNSTTSGWGQPQQNQPQQPQQNAFGQPSAFGGGGAFGSGGAFAQPQQQQQQPPQVNPMFGNLGGTPSNNAPSPGFGAFGNNANTASNAGVFGAPKPAAGFGAFGGAGPSAFGGGSGAFGNNTNAGPSTAGAGVFGSQTNATSAFGNTGGNNNSPFGAPKPATGAFGTPAQNTTDAVAPPTNGSGTAPFTAYTEKDGTSTANLSYQSITCMPQYRGASFEELRTQDYAQGRRIAGATGAFGQSAFAAAPQPATGIFGQPAAPNNSGANPLFGGGGGAFGNANAINNPSGMGATGGAFGAFGQPAQPVQGTGAFGNNSFGQQNQQQQPSTGFGSTSVFGQPQQPPQQNAFGSNNAFGAPKPATGFGALSNTGTGAFGNATGAFGQQNQQQPAATSVFGQQNPQQQQPANAFGAFGSTNTTVKPANPLFGGSQPNTAFGAFGQANQPNQQQPGAPSNGLFGTSVFGQNNQQQPNTQQAQPASNTNPLFGNNPPAQSAGGGLFGGGGGGGGLFGNNNTPQNQQQNQSAQQTNAFGIFGQAKPSAPAAPGGGLFGSGFGQQNNTNTVPSQSSSIFGTPLGQSAAQPQTNNNYGGGLFGKPAAPAFGSTPSNNLGGNSTLGTSTLSNLFGSTNTMNASNAGPGAQGSLQASIAQPISASSLLGMFPPGPRAVNVDQQKKRTGLFVDMPTRSPVPRIQLAYTPANSKLRGFASTATIPAANGNSLGNSVSFTTGKPNAMSLNNSINQQNGMGPEAFLNGGGSSPSLGSGGRSNVKKLILNKKIAPADLFGRASNVPSSKVLFNPALGIAAREKEAAANNTAMPFTTPVKEPPSRNTTRFAAHSLSDEALAEKETSKEKEVVELQEGDYWVKPDLEILKQLSYDELVSFKGLVVGRVGYGEVHFLDPVDLTGLPKLGALLGEVVRFDDQECAAYPDSDESEKPPPGTGLNVRSRIELLRCWAMDKATREPIKDETHPAAVRHLKRLKHMKHTRFEGFDLQEGKWTFTVDHF